ncbi:hypothetical protein MMC15_005269 [Xylographa vitiligo]|nr:hypothetical protein [Xylographa vitiligo]
MSGLQQRRSETGFEHGVAQEINTVDSIVHDDKDNSHHSHLPRYNHNGHLVQKGIHPDGESGRNWVHPWMFLKICFKSSSLISKLVNVLWPFVPAAVAVHFAKPDAHLWVFALNYIAMVPTANLIGFAGQELARKLPKVVGVLLETFLGSIVEIVLFMVLLANNDHGNLIPVIRDAILGSILANLLLCLGMCFFVGGMRRDKQEFDSVVSEVGSGLLLTGGFGLIIPCAFSLAVGNDVDSVALDLLVLKISRATAVILLIAFIIYVWFQMRTHHSIFHTVLELDEEKDADREEDLAKHKLTFTECILALLLSIACVSMHAIFLVQEIEIIVEQTAISDMFMGLILVPLVEKFAEHLTAIDEAWDNSMNFALAHVLGSSLQTALLNSSLVVIVGWGLGIDMNLNFSTFQAILLVLAILVVNNFLRDGESNYLEGALCVLVYLIIAVTTFFFPN